jgi:hypothetical protein
MRLTVAVTLLAAAPAIAAERKIPFWPDAVPEAIHAAVDGGAALETVRELSRFHRVQGSPGFAAAAELIRRKAAAAGLADATVERFPADGKTRYAHFLAYLGWEANEAQLDEVSPRPRPLPRFPDLPVALADYSQDADVTAELVDVGAGVSPSDYEGRDVSGRIVLASGALPTVHRMAVEQRGASGFLSDYPNQTTAWSGDDRDLVRWGHLSPYQVKNTFAFMLSKRQSEALRTRLQAGERIQLRARVKARMVPATYDLVSASIPGSDANAGEVLLTAHLCHQSAGANDNASGSAAVLEVARSLSAAIRAGALPAPRRTIRFLWTPEIAGTQVWMARRSESAPRIVAGVHMDMVGGLLSKTRGTLHVSRTAESLPHVANDIAQAFFHEVVAASARHAERGGDPWAGFVFGSGSREVLLGDVRRVEMGSDHDVLQAAGWGVPTVYFHDWPDVTIHTNKDQPENLDATKLGRVAYMGAGIAYTLAGLPDGEVPRLLAVLRASAEESLARARLRAALADDPRDGALAVRESLTTAKEALGALRSLWPSAATSARELEARWTAEAPKVAAVPRGDGRVPVRSPEVRGPLQLYYYDHVAESLAARGLEDVPVSDFTGYPDDAELIAYEALNLADGRRSVTEIRDVLTGRYGPVSIATVSAEFERLSARGWCPGGRPRRLDVEPIQRGARPSGPHASRGGRG